MAKKEKEKNKKRYIKVDGVTFTLIKKVYDSYLECYFYYVKESKQPFCDLDGTIEEIER